MGQFHFRVVACFVFAVCHGATATAEPQQAETAAAVAQVSLTAEQLFSPDHLVDISIDLAEADWELIRHQSRSLSEALGRELPESPFTYVKGNVTIDGIRIEDVGIRKKGFLGSLSRSRPSLKIKFAEYVDQAPVSGLDRLTLNNNNQDPSRLSQYLSYKVFNDVGTIAPRCNFAKVTVNGDCLGIYSNVESFKRPFLKRFGDDSGALYEGTVTDFFPDLIDKFEFKNKRCQASDLESLAELLHAKPLDVDAVAEVLDIDAFLRFWATESLIGFWDGYTNDQNNFFIYKNPTNQKLYFIPWGTDSSFVQTMPLPPYIIPNKSVHSQSVLANRLYTHPQIRERYHAVMRELLADHWNEESLLSDIDRVEKLISEHVTDSNRKFKSSLRKVRYFIESRRKVLDDEIAAWPVELKEGPKKPPYFEPIGKANVRFETKWFDKKPKSPASIGNVDLTLEMNGEKVAFKKLGSYSSFDENSKGADGKAPPTIVFTGIRKTDGKSLILGVGMKAADFHPTGEGTIDVEGLVIEGNPVWFFAKMMMGSSEMVWLRGTAKFTKAEMKDGSPVEGEMDLLVTEMIGGKPVD